MVLSSNLKSNSKGGVVGLERERALFFGFPRGAGNFGKLDPQIILIIEALGQLLDHAFPKMIAWPTRISAGIRKRVFWT